MNFIALFRIPDSQRILPCGVIPVEFLRRGLFVVLRTRVCFVGRHTLLHM